MKKIIVIAMSLVLVLGAVVFVSADAVQGITADSDREAFMEQRIQYQLDYIAQLLKDGKITQEQADLWTEHFNAVEEFHDTNGYLGCPMGGPVNGQGRGYGRGFGGGMMGGQGFPAWGQQNSTTGQ